MQFRIRALSAGNEITRLTLEAADEADARRQLAARGLLAAELVVQAAPFWRRRRQPLSLLLFAQELLALLTAGLSIVESIEALLEREASPAVREVFARLLEALREGRRFSAALEAQPGLFPPLFSGIVRSAEGTSDLPRALERFIDYQQRIDLVRNKVVAASIYPLILLMVGAGVCLFLVGYVVPRFADVYQGSGRELHFLSRLLLDWGQFASTHAGATAITALALLVAAALGLRQFVQSGGIARLLARMPGVGERIRIYALARLYLTLGMLLEGGIPLVAALATANGMLSGALRARLLGAREAVESGMPLSLAFEAEGLCTPISLRMMRVGERTGELGLMLSRSAAFYDGETGRWIDRFTRALEPALMAAIGIVVGTIVVLLYMPIFDLAGSLS